MRANPFHKFLGPEDHLQHQVITWLKYQHPKIKYHHSPNEGKRSDFEKFKYSYLGSDSGFPDLIIPEKKLVIELKIKPNRPSVAQLEWLAYFKMIGWRAEVCYSFEETIKLFTCI
jgi:hypothetical protein